MAYTQQDIDIEKGLVDALYKRREIEWSSQPVENSSGYSVKSWEVELKKCSDSFSTSRDESKDSTKNGNPTYTGHINTTKEPCKSRWWNFIDAFGQYRNINDAYKAHLKIYNQKLFDFSSQPEQIKAKTEQLLRLANEKKQRTKWIFFGLAVLIIFGVAFFLIRRTVKT